MSGNDDEPQVPNPLISAINRLKTRTETAVSETPNMDAPTGSIGDGPAWTGSVAREIHEDLALQAEAVKTALNHIVDDVEESKSDLEPMVSASLAQVIRHELDMR